MPPVDIPLTIPVPPTVATRGFPELQVPPLTPSPRLMDAPEHTVPGPLILPAEASGSMVTVAEVVAEPQLLLTV